MSKLLRCSSISDLVMYFSTLPLNFSALHFAHSYTTLEGVPKFAFDTPSNYHLPDRRKAGMRFKVFDD